MLEKIACIVNGLENSPEQVYNNKRRFKTALIATERPLTKAQFITHCRLLIINGKATTGNVSTKVIFIKELKNKQTIELLNNHTKKIISPNMKTCKCKYAMKR